jgi:hypothetical protein
MPCFLESPGNPVRLGLIGRVEADEELLSHRALPAASRSFGYSVTSDYRNSSWSLKCFIGPRRAWECHEAQPSGQVSIALPPYRLMRGGSETAEWSRIVPSG